MDIFVNDEPVELEYEAGKSLSEILMLVQDNCFEPGMIVTAILLDGEMLEPQRLAELKTQPVSDFTELNFVVRPANTFAAEGLITVCGHLDHSIALRSELVESLQQGNTRLAMQKLNDYIKFWSGLQSTLASACRIVNVDVESLEVVDEDQEATLVVMDHITSLSEQLSEVKSALESGDMVLLSDIIEYEFSDLTANWRNLLYKMALQFDPNLE